MTEKKTYDSDQIKDAKKLADVLISVKGESRPVFALMVERPNPIRSQSWRAGKVWSRSRMPTATMRSPPTNETDCLTCGKLARPPGTAARLVTASITTL